MNYYEVVFSLSAPREQIEDAADLVACLAGEVGFESFGELETDASKHENTTPDGNAIVFGTLASYVQREMFDDEAHSRLCQLFDDFPMADVSVSWTVSEADNADWNAVWEAEGFEPIVIAAEGNACLSTESDFARTVIIHDGRHLPQRKPVSEGKHDIMIEIDTQLAFGTGHHETTRLMVGALSQLHLDGLSVLDCGCGTGILSICALLCGARLAVGYDIDEWSVRNARHNAEINHVGDSFRALLGDAAILDSMKETLNNRDSSCHSETFELGEDFDVVVANINRNILLTDMPRFVRVMRTDGSLLILSGFYAADVHLLRERAESLGLAIVCVTTLGEWARVVLRK